MSCDKDDIIMFVEEHFSNKIDVSGEIFRVIK